MGEGSILYVYLLINPFFPRDFYASWPPRWLNTKFNLLKLLRFVIGRFVYSGMRSETLEEVELTGVRPSLPAVRTFTRGNTGVEEVYVDTDNGPVCVAVQGDRSRPPILTYHDLGLNCECIQICQQYNMVKGYSKPLHPILNTIPRT